MSPKPPQSRDDYTVGWISALPIELAAAQALLDEVHPNLRVPQNDHNTYTLGKIGEHNVVIACLPSGIYGTTSAATVATRLSSTFPSVRFGLMVGIGGGIPSRDADIRLGDVVVSKPTHTHGGVIQFDFGKATTRPGRSFERTGTLNAPPQVLLTALAKLQATHLTQDERYLQFLGDLATKCPVGRDFPFARPDAEDILYSADFLHVDPTSKTCACCDVSRAIPRPPRLQLDRPAVHYGLIASGNRVVKNAMLRSRLCKELGAYCVEMEAAGLMNNYPCLVVRGICDYADSHKNKAWQGYAAATAAAFAKEILLAVPAEETSNLESVRVPAPSVAVPHYCNSASCRSVAGCLVSSKEDTRVNAPSTTISTGGVDRSDHQVGTQTVHGNIHYGPVYLSTPTAHFEKAVAEARKAISESNIRIQQSQQQRNAQNERVETLENQITQSRPVLQEVFDKIWEQIEKFRDILLNAHIAFAGMILQTDDSIAKISESTSEITAIKARLEEIVIEYAEAGSSRDRESGTVNATGAQIPATGGSYDIRPSRRQPARQTPETAGCDVTLSSNMPLSHLPRETAPPVGRRPGQVSLAIDEQARTHIDELQRQVNILRAENEENRKWKEKVSKEEEKVKSEAKQTSGWGWCVIL
ncbi:nucleoside phosphorylase domain-containing protein [Aspergillus heterothallicus]